MATRSSLPRRSAPDVLAEAAAEPAPGVPLPGGFLLPAPPPNDPPWLALLRKSAVRRFQTLGLPTSRHETWRQVDLRPLLQTAFQPAQPELLSPGVIRELAITEADASRLVFVNGHFSQALSNVQGLPEGLIVSDLQSLLAGDPDRLRPYFAGDAGQEPDAFAALNLAAFNNGPVVIVPEKTRLAQPVQVIFYQAGAPDRLPDCPTASHNRGLFVVGRSAKLTLFVQFAGAPEGGDFNNAVLDLVVAEGGKINATVVQAEGREGFGLVTARAILAQNSRLAMTTSTFEGRLCRQAVTVDFLGEGALCELNGLNVLKNKTQTFIQTEIRHRAPHCTSRQVFKGILDDASRNDFQGTIVVSPDAQQTDSTQLNKNLLLSDEARAFARPHLRIDADDVKCAHGATVGQLDEEELFYLAARGLNREVATCLLTFGFAEDVVRNIPLPAIRRHLDHWVLHNLGQTSSPVRCFATCGDCPTPEHSPEHL